ncbi:MAG: hypothetical protein WD825_14035 [Gemmatimonadaceae bacterium]
MQRIPTSVNMTIFILFFGISLLDALATHNWWRAAFWLAIGLVFLGASRFGRADRVDRVGREG